MRQLASIQKIKTIHPIENTDQIEVARILGWDVVVKKGDFQPGDLAIYIEIDSIMPDHPEFEFLKNSKGKMQRIRTVKLRGQISQGIAFPLDIIRKINSDININQLKEGDDLTKDLNIVKYEPPEEYYGPGSGGKNRRKTGSLKRPTYVPATDETIVQILENVLQKYQGTLMYITEKLDGSSFSASWNRGKFEVCSRNFILPEPYIPFKQKLLNIFRKFFKKELVHAERVDAWWKIAYKLELEDRMRTYCKTHDLNSLTLQGELIGPRIQKNKYDLKEFCLYCFQLYNPERNCYYNFYDYMEAIKEMCLHTTPIISDDYILSGTSDDLLELAKGKSILNPKIPREGIVLRPLKEITDTSFPQLHRSRLSFKVINNDFLLKYRE